MCLYSGGLIIGRIFASEIWGGGGLIFGRAYFFFFFFGGGEGVGHIIGILRYITTLKLARLRFLFTANANGKNYHVIMIFPPFFTFAVCRFQREEDCFRVRQQREYLP